MKNKHKLIFLLIITILVNASITNAQKDTLYKYLKVEVNGSIRTKYEYNFSTDKHRFNVRNARFSLSGLETPFFITKQKLIYVMRVL